MTDKSSLPDFRRLVEGLAPLRFEAADTSSTTSPAVQTYLDYYQINFSKTNKDIIHRFGFLPNLNTRVVAHTWWPKRQARATVFLVHGYYDHVGVYQKFIHFLLSSDFAVVAYDAPGHGLSDGEPACIDTFDQYADVLHHCIEWCLHQGKKVLPSPWYLVGQSTGAAVIMNYIYQYWPLSDGANSGNLKSRPEKDNVLANHLEEKYRELFDKIILLAPLVRAHRWPYLCWLYEMLRGKVKQLPRSFSPSSHDSQFNEFIAHDDPLQARVLPLKWVGAKKQWIKKIKAASVRDERFLIIQGDHDKTVDWRYNTALIQRQFPNSELQMVDGARHHLINESFEYRQVVFSKIYQYLQ